MAEHAQRLEQTLETLAEDGAYLVENGSRRAQDGTQNESDGEEIGEIDPQRT